MIVTVTLNAAVDVTYRVPRLLPHTTHRVTHTEERPGGKGLNVARVLAAIGHTVTATGFAGGTTGEALRTALTDADGVTDALVPIAGTTRRTVCVVAEDGGPTGGGSTLFNEPGPAVTAQEWAAFLDGYRGLLAAGASTVALCGSLPPGLPVGSYAGLIRDARTAGVPVLLDTDGEPLRRGLAARPDIVKPNAEELAGLTGQADPQRAARDARRRGARAVAASLGAGGMLAVTTDGAWQAVPPSRPPGNPTGAGDSAVAGLLSGLVEGLDWPSRLARATALSAATVGTAVAGEFDRAVYEELLPRVELVQLLT